MDGRDHDEGEYSLMLFDGASATPSSSGRKPAIFGSSRISAGRELPCEPPPGPKRLARAALAAAPAEAAYARVDMVADDEGQLRIMELELIEPALWMEHAPDGGALRRAFGARSSSSARRRAV